MAHVHGQIYIKEGLVPIEEKIIKNKHKNFQWLNDAIRLQTELAIIHRQGYSKGKSTQTQDNIHADQVANEYVLGEPKAQNLMELSCLEEYVPEFDPEKIKSYFYLETQ